MQREQRQARGPGYQQGQPDDYFGPSANRRLQHDLHVEARGAGRDVDPGDRQHQRNSARPPVPDQPPGGSFTSRSSPPEDQQRERHRGRGPEQHEHEKVVGHDRAGHACLRQQQQREI